MKNFTLIFFAPGGVNLTIAYQKFKEKIDEKGLKS